MKYEMIFGNPSLFDDADRSIDLIRYNRKIGLYFKDSLCNLSSSLLEQPIVAMRRIIKEPKRWTVEDQKAGRSPDVGCMVMVTSFDECASVAAINNDAVCVVFHDGEFNTLHKSGISPLETPEEKAERLRSEWCSECTSKYYPRGHKGFPEMIYDALLSGALPVPTKGGE